MGGSPRRRRTAQRDITRTAHAPVCSTADLRELAGRFPAIRFRRFTLIVDAPGSTPRGRSGKSLTPAIKVILLFCPSWTGRVEEHVAAIQLRRVGNPRFTAEMRRRQTCSAGAR